MHLNPDARRVFTCTRAGRKGDIAEQVAVLTPSLDRRSVSTYAMADILCIGIDDASMQVKRSTLERAGHTVSLAKDVLQVIAACSGIRFDVILIGQTLPGKEKLRVHELLQDHCSGAKILEQFAATPDLPAAAAHIRANQSSEDLVAVVEGLIARRKSA